MEGPRATRFAMSLFAELRRRNVLKVALAYALAGWVVFLGADAAIALLDLPVWAKKFVVLLLLIGFPVALIFAWFYEITPTGLKKEVDVDQTQSIVYKTGQKLNAAVAVLLVLGVAGLVGERLLPKWTLLTPSLPTQVPAAANVPQEIASWTMENGLKIIVWPDHDIPNVVMYNFVRAGGRNEYPGITGLSHFFEHMMFNGTSTRAPGEFDRIMEAAGGASNAYTSSDITVYQNWFPRSALDVIFALESDRLQNLTSEPELVESERGVVYSERRTSVDNDNAGMLFEQVQATAYVAHPYQFPVIGWPSDIEAWTQEDLAAYFRTYYAPNNCTMVFTGDVTAEEIFVLAEKYFASIPAQVPPVPIRTVEPEQTGDRRLLVEAPAQTPLLHLAFHAGSASDPETLPLSLLLTILVEGDSSRLHRLLVEEEQLAISVSGYQDEGFDPGLVYFYLTLPLGADPAAAESRLLDELYRVVREGVSDAEISKARNLMLADFWRRLATIDGKASALGQFEVFNGGYEKLFDLPDDVEAINVEQLREVAAKVFKRTNVTVGVLRSPATVVEPGQ